MLISFLNFIQALSPYDLEIELLEHELLGFPDTNHNKYRISFKMPKTKKNWQKGHFDDDIVYVSAPSNSEAKKIAIQWIQNRLEPHEGDARPKRVPKRNYLKDTDKKYLQLKSRVVGSWSDIVKLLEYLATHKENPEDFFDEGEYRIILDVLQHKLKNRYLNKLGSRERVILKKILLTMWQSPEFHNFKDEVGNLTKSIDLAPQKKTDRWANDFEPTPQEPQSIYQQKLTPKEANQILTKIHTLSDVVRESNRLGITKPELDQEVQRQFGHEILQEKELRNLFKELYKKVKIPSTSKKFDTDDPADKSWRGKVDWESLAIDWLPGFSFESIPVALPPSLKAGGLFGGETEYDEYLEWAVPFLYNLYRNGPPKPKQTLVERYKIVLEQIMNDIIQRRDTDEVPF